jgi:hypothetical protein
MKLAAATIVCSLGWWWIDAPDMARLAYLAGLVMIGLDTYTRWRDRQTRAENLPPQAITMHTARQTRVPAAPRGGCDQARPLRPMLETPRPAPRPRLRRS